MAQYTVTAGGCGHTETLQLYGPTRERDRRIDWAKSPTGMCKACYAASKQAEEIDAVAARIASFAAEFRAGIARSGKAITAEQAARLRQQLDDEVGGPANANRRAAMALVLTEMGY